MNRAELRKLMDVCRDEADLPLPEFKLLAEQMASDPSVRRDWERARRFNESIGTALRDVPVPEGLEERIRHRLSIHRDPQVMDPQAMDPQAMDPQAMDPQAMDPQAMEEAVRLEASPDAHAFVSRAQGATSAPRRFRSRWSMWAGSLVSIAAVVAVMIAVFSGGEPTLTKNEQEHAIEWISLVREGVWSAENAPTSDYPLPGQLAVAPVRWQRLAGSPGSVKVVCYEFPSAGSRAYLFVALAKPRSSLPTAPPASLYPISPRPWAVGVWRGVASVYVLAVQGGPDQYQRLIGARRMWVAAKNAGNSCLAGKA